MPFTATGWSTAPALAKLIAGLETLGPWRVGLDTEPQDFESGHAHVSRAAKLFDAYLKAVGQVLAANSDAVEYDADEPWDATQSAVDGRWGLLRDFETAADQSRLDNSAFARACNRADLTWKERGEP